MRLAAKNQLVAMKLLHKLLCAVGHVEPSGESPCEESVASVSDTRTRKRKCDAINLH